MVDFVRESKPGRGPNSTSRLTIDSKVVMSPWAVKRLALDLGWIFRRYEEIHEASWRSTHASAPSVLVRARLPRMIRR